MPAPAPSPVAVAARAKARDRPMVLLSGPGDPELTEWSYAALESAGSFSSFEAAARLVTGGGPNPPGLPPFTGGAVGYVGYDAAWAYAPKPRPPRPDPLGLPGQRFHRYDAIYARHEPSGRGLVLAEPTPGARARAARLREAVTSPGWPPPGGLMGPLRSTVDRRTHEARIRVALERIGEGEIYQVNLVRGLVGHYAGAPLAALGRLDPPPPFAAYLRVDADAHIVSASPECFFDLTSDGRLRSYPIKGTRRRSPKPTEDRAHAAALHSDPKERAEHLMIVDLIRNDLGRLAEPGSVRVDGLAYLESFSTVHHLTSRVEARLPRPPDPGEFARALFPGGSITGAPKLRAMEVIDELEGKPRGIATGAILWIDRSGAMRASIAIRTAALRGGRLFFGVGGGIVADSDPGLEWEETVLKAEALERALGRTP